MKDAIRRMANDEVVEWKCEEEEGGWNAICSLATQSLHVFQIRFQNVQPSVILSS